MQAWKEYIFFMSLFPIYTYYLLIVLVKTVNILIIFLFILWAVVFNLTLLF